MPEGQTAPGPRTSEGQHTTGGPEQQGPAAQPPRNREGQQTAQPGRTDQQPRPLLPTHPSSGAFPNTNPDAAPSRGQGGLPATRRTNF
jgi:hypothetical protein